MTNIPAPIGHHIIELMTVDSTNNYAMGRVNEGAVTEGTVYCAYQQTAGKGQREKVWLTEPGMNILLSAVLQPGWLALSDQFLLSATVALGVYDFFSGYAGDLTKIKWSNDLYWGDRKAGGILIENVLRGNNWSYAIAGIGININQVGFPAPLPNPVSLRQITGRTYDVKSLATELCAHLDRRYRQLRDGSGRSGILEDYVARLYRLDETASYRMNGQTFEGVIRGVQPDGKLILEKDGRVLQVDFGEIAFTSN